MTTTDAEPHARDSGKGEWMEIRYLGRLIEPHSFPAPVPETQPEDAGAQEVFDDILTACRNEINDPRHGATTPYEDPEQRPGWAGPRPSG